MKNKTIQSGKMVKERYNIYIYIYTGTFDKPHSPTIVVEFTDEEGKQHRGESQMFKEVNKYQSGDEIEFKYKLNETSTFKNIFGTEGFARIHVFDDELQEYNSKPGDMIFNRKII